MRIERMVAALTAVLAVGAAGTWAQPNPDGAGRPLFPAWIVSHVADGGGNDGIHLRTVVFVTKKDFSFMGPILSICSWVALGFIVCAILFGFSLGLFFVLAMIGLMSGWILYQTSAVLHHYPTDMHVAAALELFAAIATLFWYIIQLVMEMSSRD